MTTLTIVIAYPNPTQTKIMEQLTKIYKNENFNLQCVGVCSNLYTLYSYIKNKAPFFLVIDEEMYSPCINYIAGYSEVILVSKNRLLEDNDNIHYCYTPFQPADIMSKIESIVSTYNESQIENRIQAIHSFLFGLNLPAKYYNAIDDYYSTVKDVSHSETYSEQWNKIDFAVSSGLVRVEDTKRPVRQNPTTPLFSAKFLEKIGDPKMLPSQSGQSQEQSPAKLRKLVITQVGKINYTEGETFDFSEFAVSALYKDGHSEPITPQMDIHPLTTNDRFVIFSYENRTVSQMIRVTEKTVKKAFISTSPKIVYAIGESFAANGGEVELDYSDGTSVKIPISDDMVHGFDTVKPGEFIACLTVGKSMISFNYSVETTVQNTQPQDAPQDTPQDAVQDAPQEVTQEVTQDVPQDEAQDETQDTPQDTVQDNPVPIDDSSSDLSADVVEPSVADKSSAAPEDNSLVDTTPTTPSFIECLHYPKNKVFFVGDSVNKADFIVRVTYSNGTVELVNDFSLFPSKIISQDIDSIQISWNGLSVSVPLSIKEKEVAALMIGKVPAKTNYVVGESLDLTGGSVNVYYSDNSFESKPITDDMVSGYEADKQGQQMITVSYNDKSTIFPVFVSQPKLTRVELQTPPDRTEFFAGESFDPKGLVIRGVYNDGTMKEGIEFDYDNSPLKESAQSVDIFVDDIKLPVYISVKSPFIKQISMHNLPTKTEYMQNEPFDSTGGIIEVLMTNNTSKLIPLQDCEIDGFNSNVIGDCQIIVVYENYTCVFNVSIIEKIAQRIEVVNPPLKTAYNEGESFDPTGLVLEAVFANGTVKQTKEFTVPTELLTINDRSITLTCFKKDISIPISVSPVQIDGIAMAQMPDKLKYAESSENFNCAGGKVIVLYRNGSGTTIPLTDDMVSGFDNSTSGDIPITVNYRGQTTSFIVTIEPKVLVGIVVIQYPVKLTYVAGEYFDPTGMMVEGYYKRGIKNEVTRFCSTLPTRPLSLEDTSVTVIFMDKKVYVPIKVTSVKEESDSTLPLNPPTQGIPSTDNQFTSVGQPPVPDTPTGNLYVSSTNLRFED